MAKEISRLSEYFVQDSLGSTSGKYQPGIDVEDTIAIIRRYLATTDKGGD